MQFNNFIGLAIIVYEPRHLKEKKKLKKRFLIHLFSHLHENQRQRPACLDTPQTKEQESTDKANIETSKIVVHTIFLANYTEQQDMFGN